MDAEISLAVEAYGRLKAKRHKTAIDECVIAAFEDHVREMASGARIMLALARAGREGSGPGKVIHWNRFVEGRG